MPGQLLEHVLEHGMKRVVEAVTQNAVLLGFLGRRLHLVGKRAVQSLVLLGRPFAERDEMIRGGREGIAQRPFLALMRGAVGSGIV
jgi:hypothetical protein